jgi:2-haloacid dehalogenase
MIKGLLLDFYGTVVEEDDEVLGRICAAAAATADAPVPAEVVAAAWRGAYLAAVAAGPFRPLRQISVESLDTALRRTGCRADPAALCVDQFAFWCAAPLRPGTREFLDRLRLPACLVSNADRADLDAVLTHHDLSFTAAVTSEDVRSYKPAPEIFRRALAELGLAADEVIHVGDSLTADIAGARAAGIRTAWVNRRHQPVPTDLAATTTVIDTLPDLLAPLGWDDAR